MIELKNISKSFGTREVLKDINLSVKEGELISIMGKSGSGKTTLLNILGFFEYLTKGKYYFEGKLIKNENQMSRIRNMNMGFVFQAYNLIPRLTVYENIMLPIYYSLDRKHRKERIKGVNELIEKYGLIDIKDSFVENISGGEKQRACMARALVCDAGLIISDEPTGNLDENNKNNVLDMFKEMNKNGKTIIIVTHDKQVENIATRKYFLEEGELKEREMVAD
ncbi:MAG: ABC transporter ATP-binding protein [Lachnospiraceae bacterium]|nr:ABC transporter ATP-binding protein [Lachnospiraceae bacterium]